MKNQTENLTMNCTIVFTSINECCAIRGVMELLLNSKNLEITQRKDLQVILKNAIRLERMVSKIESKMYELRMERT